MKDFKLNPFAVPKEKAVKLFLSSGIVIASASGLTGCSGNHDKPNDTQPTTQDVVTETKPDTNLEKTPEELEAEALQDFQIVPDGKTYNNEILERYNKIQAYRYIVNPGRDQSEVIELIPPTEEGLAELQKNGRVHQFIESVILPCCFVFYTKDEGWIKTHPGKMWDTRRDFYVVSNKQYKYISDEDLYKLFGDENPGKSFQFGEEQKDKDDDKVAMVYKIGQKIRI